MAVVAVAGFGMLWTTTADAASLAATAASAPQVQYVNRSASYSFKIKNTGTPDHIRGVIATRPSSSWTISSCSAPTGWTAVQAASTCTYTDASDSDDIVPGSALSDFKAVAAVGPSETDVPASGTAQWTITVSSTRTFDSGTVTDATARDAGALDAKAYSFAVNDLIVSETPAVAGDPCPAANHGAPAGSTRYIIVCGRNFTQTAKTPAAAFSSLTGSFVTSPGTFESGSVAPSADQRVLGQWNGAQVSATPDNGSLTAQVGAAANITSPLRTIGNYSATPVNQAPVAQDDTLTSVAEDSGQRTIPFTDLTGNDSPGPASESGQTLTITSVSNPVGGSVSTLGTNVLFTPTTDFNGPASFDYTVQDDGVSPGPMSDVGHASFTITEVNDAPTATDDALASFNEDSPQRTIRFRTLLDNDTKGPTNESGQTLTITGVNNALGGSASISGTDVLFTPTANFNGSAGFDYTVQDNGTTDGSADPKTDVGSVSFTIDALNDGPVNTVPSARTVDEDTDLVFGGNLSVTDVDSALSSIKVSLDVTRGKLTLASTSGLSFVDGTANGTGSVHVTGALSDINTALNGLVYRGNLNYNGTDKLTIVTDDQGNTGAGGARTDTDSVSITVKPVNDAPTAGADASDALGNTRLAFGNDSSGPRILVSGNIRSNDSDVDTPKTSLTITGATVSSSQCASCNNVTINADGTFLYDPPQGFTGTDTFTYTLNDNDTGDAPSTAQSSVGTVTITVQGPMIWYVDGDASAPAAGQGGRSHSPFNSLADLRNGGAADAKDGSGDIIFVYSAASPYTGGIDLETNQKLVGEPLSLDVDPNGSLPLQTNLVPSNHGSNPIINNASGNGVTLANGVQVDRIDVTSASGAAFAGTSITNAAVGRHCAASGASGAELLLSGAASGTVDFGCNIVNTAGRAVDISGRSGGAVNLPGAITDSPGGTGTGIFLNSNTGATIAFTGDLELDTGNANAFFASNGGTVTADDLRSTLTTTTGTPLTVTGTNIGAAGLTFKSISANGATNGIVLNNTGSAGGLTVTGLGTVSQGGDDSGGIIQSTTGDAVSLTNTQAPSFTNLKILNSAGHGINGTGVTGFTLADSKIQGAGDAAGENSITFASSTSAANLSGAVNITNNQIIDTEAGGIDIVNYAGTISALTISDNSLDDTGDTATPGSAVVVNVNAASGATKATLTKADITNNNVSDFRAGDGFVLQGNSDPSGAASITMGTPGDASKTITVTGNLMNGGSGGVGNQPDRFVTAAMSGPGQANLNISNNGTAGNPITNFDGVVIEVSSFGPPTMAVAIDNNRIVANNAVSNAGIAVGCGVDPYAGTTDNGQLTSVITNNNVSGTDGPTIYALARDSGSTCTHFTKIQNNTLAAPATTSSARAGLRVDSGSSGSLTTVCANISGNTTAGSTNTGTGSKSPGINLRLQSGGSVFGINGMAATSTPGVENYVNSLNPASASGTFGVGGTALLSATTGFTNCSFP